MKVYFATSSLGEAERVIPSGAKHFLLSAVFTHSNMKNNLQLISLLKKNRDVEIFLDSGAYSIRQGTANLSLDQYCDYVRVYGKWFEAVTALDVIGEPEQSLSNYEYMMQNSATHRNFVLTWHHGESYKHLDTLTKLSDYIGIGGVVSGDNKGMPSPKKLQVIRRATERIRSTRPNCRVHAFGIGSMQILTKMWDQLTSADHSSWLRAERWKVSGMQIFSPTNSGKVFLYGSRQSVLQGYLANTEYNVRKLVSRYKELDEYVEKQRDKDKLEDKIKVKLRDKNKISR